MGIIVDTHGWRGIHGYTDNPDLFHLRITCGFFTIFLCRFCVVDRLRWLARQTVKPRDPEQAMRINGGE